MHSALDAKIWSIAWPAILANISIPLLGLVDAALLGHLDSSLHLAAVAVGGAVLSFLYWGFGFLRMGTTGEVARASGAGDEGRAFLSLGRASALALAIALMLLLFRDPLLSLGLTAMGPEPEVGAVAERYATLRMFSAPAVLLTYTLTGWFIGHRNTLWPMRIVIVTNLLNIALDALFILGFEMASGGAALATVIAEYCGLAIAVYGLAQQTPQRPDAKFWQALRVVSAYMRLLRSNLQLFFRTLSLIFAFAFFTAAGEKLGSDVVAANAVMIQFLMFAAFALDGFAYAAEGLAGQALGGRDTNRFFAISRRCALWTALATLVVSVTILISRNWLFPVLTDIPQVLAVMHAQGLWLVLLPLVAAPSYLLDGLFIGAGATGAMMSTMFFSTFLVYLPCWYLTTEMGNNGLWLAFTLFNLARSVSLGLIFWQLSRRQHWLRWESDPSA
ncbi:MAG: MATE family efflux transporter [Congregibacter sp.]